jgi:hypothetical protein
MGDSVLRNGAINVSVFRNVTLDKVDFFELSFVQDRAEAVEAGIDVENIGPVTTFQQNLRNPRANESLGACNKEAFLSLRAGQ